MNKTTIITLIAMFALLLAGCGKTVHKEEIEFNGGIVEYEFTLSPESEIYDISIGIDYRPSIQRELIRAVVTSPSEQNYSSSIRIGDMRQTNRPSKITTFFSIKDIEQEEGNYRLTITQEGNRNTVNSATIRIKK